MNTATHPFELFIVCPIGFEEIQLQEIIITADELNLEILESKKLKGGIEVQTNDLHFVTIIPYLKVATRVLLRLTTFKVRDFPKLYNKVKKFNWGPYLYREDQIDIQVTLRKSRLIHSGRAKDSIEKAIKEWLRGNPRKKISDTAASQKIYLHIEEDLCQISIDLCGSPLYQRENKNQGAIAPIRENLASGLIQWTLSKLNIGQGRTFNELEKKLTFIDPMCGSGTFIFEAARLTTPNTNKNLSVHYIPATKGEFKKVGKNISKSYFSEFIGIDQNQFFSDKRQELENVSFISKSYKQILKDLPRDAVFIFNPPYGKRIKIIGERVDFYQNVIRDMVSMDAKAIGMIVPEEVPLKIKMNHYQQEILRFKNGGLAVRYILLIKNEPAI